MEERLSLPGEETENTLSNSNHSNTTNNNSTEEFMAELLDTLRNNNSRSWPQLFARHPASMLDRKQEGGNLLQILCDTISRVSRPPYFFCFEGEIFIII